MEERLSILTPDKHTIFGTLNKSKKKSEKVIVFVHGLGRSQNDHIFYNASKFFTKHGFDTLRFDFYSFEDEARKLNAITVAIQIKDLTTILEHVSKSYKQIFLVGHSLGGPMILGSDTAKVNAIALWDPSYEVPTLAKKFCFIETKTKTPYAYRGGMQVVINKALFDEFMSFPDCGELIKKIKKPIKIISAEKGGLLEGGKKYAERANEPKDFVMIANSNHYFDESGAEDQLFKETLKWFKRY